MEMNLFNLIHNLSGKNAILDGIMSFASKYGLIIFIVGILSLLLFQTTRKIGVYGVISIVIGLILNRLLKMLIDRPRPFVEHDISILLHKDPSPSFPSDQALIAGIFIAIFWLLGAKFRWPALMAGLIVIISRVYVGHHYPLDVLVGGLIGVVIVYCVYKQLSKRKLFTQKDEQNVTR